MKTALDQGILLGLAALLATASVALADEPFDPSTRWSIEYVEPTATDPRPRALTTELVLDDGTREADIGVNGSTAFQFLWFNQFESPGGSEAFALDEIQVLFPPGPEVVPGAAIQLVVFTDPDGDPTNGADLVAAFDDVIQVADGATFSVYPLDPPLPLPLLDDVLLGVVNRYVESGVSPPSRPAALDTSSSAGRSWLAEWTTDPPNPPTLPSDLVLAQIDTIQPGNWMIRGSGSSLGAVGIPALGPTGTLTLALLLALAAVAVLRLR